MTVRYRYTVTLLSDACCGSGTGNGSDVDVRASFDGCGLPMIPAKRLRGLLRECAFLLIEKYDKDRLVSLFGESGGQSRLRLGDARLSTDGADNAEELGAVLRASGYSVREIESVFGRKRTQTAIDGESGKAKETTLRTLETIPRGTVFSGTFSVSGADETDCELLENAFRLLDAVGMDKMRGLGEVRCTTERLSDSVSGFTDGYERTGAECTLSYSLYLLQDVTLSLNSVMQNPDHLPGSVLQGAFASFFAGKPYFDALFFDDLKCGNAYISDGVRTYVPAPFSLVQVKNEPEFLDFADGTERAPGKQYVSVGGYVCREGDTLYRMFPESGTDYHINLGREEVKKTFFSVIKLKKGQTFRGTVSGSEGALKAFVSAVRAGDGTLHIGSSLSAQYGECRITFAEKPEPVREVRFRRGDIVAVQLLSDAILMDESGFNTLECDALRKAVGGERVRIRKNDTDGRLALYVKNGTAGGWNTVWKLPKPQYRTFLRGSTVVFVCDEDTEALPAWIGIGNDEGYGQIACRKIYGSRPLTVRKGETSAVTPEMPEAAKKDRRGDRKAAPLRNDRHTGAQRRKERIPETERRAFQFRRHACDASAPRRNAGKRCCHTGTLCGSLGNL